MSANAESLRGMVREVLREALASRRVEQVHIGNDAELQAFVTRLTQPAMLEAIRTGKMNFKWADAGYSSTPKGAGLRTKALSGGAELSGVICEQRLAGFTEGQTLRLGAGAVLTPLARDRARKLNLKIERIR
jgi:hypothetical protein